jgi:hypothetical protein
MLVAYSMGGTHVQTTLDYLLALKRHVGCDVDYVHVTHGAVMGFDLSAYDIVFHNYCARLCFEDYVSQSYLDALRAFRGLKMLAVQDEYDNTNVLKSAIKDLGFHVVLTCVPQHSLEYVYPRAEFPGTRFETVLTGYVSDDSTAGRAGTHVKPLAERPIVIGYRGRDIGAKYGQLGFDKYEIGRRMREICKARGIPHDIAVDEGSRIYGLGWFDFVGNCRAMLGSESGSNLFDFDGSVRLAVERMSAELGRPISYAEFRAEIGDREDKVSMGQVSPRIFECAAMLTPMVLFRGQYSGVAEPDRHYIALEKDFSNVDEVLTRLEDLQALEAMARRAYEDIVTSGKYSYRTFGKRLRVIIDEEWPKCAGAVVDSPLLETPSATPRSFATLRGREAKRIEKYLEAKYARCLDWITVLAGAVPPSRQANAGEAGRKLLRPIVTEFERAHTRHRAQEEQFDTSFASGIRLTYVQFEKMHADWTKEVMEIDHEFDLRYKAAVSDLHREIRAVKGLADDDLDYPSLSGSLIAQHRALADEVAKLCRRHDELRAQLTGCEYASAADTLARYELDRPMDEDAEAQRVYESDCMRLEKRLLAGDPAALAEKVALVHARVATLERLKKEIAVRHKELIEELSASIRAMSATLQRVG